MNRELIFGLLSVLVNIAGFIPYIRDILAQKVKPQRITWTIWTILTGIAFYNQVQNGGGYSVYFFGSTFFLVVTVLLLSIKYGFKETTRFDIGCLLLALGLLGVFLVTKNTTYTTYLAAGIDMLGALPTVYKTYRHPETEAYAQWVMAAIAGFFSMLALTTFSFLLIAYPLYVFLMNTVIVATKYFAERKR